MTLIQRRKKYLRIWRFEFYTSRFRHGYGPKLKLEYTKGVCGCRLLHFYKWGITLLGKGDCYKAEQWEE